MGGFGEDMKCRVCKKYKHDETGKVCNKCKKPKKARKKQVTLEYNSKSCGKLCPSCLLNERNISQTGKLWAYCKQCVRLKNKQWRKLNPENVKKQAILYAQRNHEKVKKYKLDYRSKNKDRIKYLKEKNRIKAVRELRDSYLRRLLGGGQYDELIPAKREQIKLIRLCKEKLKT